MTRASRRFTFRQDHVYALILSILAAIPRLYRLDLAEFKLDEANHYRMAYLLTRGAWRWMGSTSSLGLPKPPFFIYALALPLSVTHDPRVVTGFLGVLSALATGAFYLVLRRFLSRRPALAAAMLYALNPQAVLYARKLFTADLLPPLCTLFLAIGTAFLTAPKRRAGRLAIAATFDYALLLLTTFSPLLLLPALAMLLWERRRDLRWTHWLAAGAALILPFTPYLVTVAPSFLAAAAGGPDPLTDVVGQSPTASPPVLLDWAWGMLHGSSWPRRLLSLEGVAAVVLSTLSLLGLCFTTLEARRKVEGKWARFFLAWLCLSLLLAQFAPFELYPHYLVILYPLIFVLPAAGVELAARKASSLGWAAFLLLVATAAWQGQGLRNRLEIAASRWEWYGTPLGYWWHAAEQARDLAEQENADEVLLLMPGDRSWDEKANVLDALLSDTPHRVVDGYTTVVYPPKVAVMMIAPEAQSPATVASPCTHDLGTDVAASPLGGAYHFRLWSPKESDARQCTPGLVPAAAQWASGARLLGYRVDGTPEPGESLQVTLLLETTEGPLKADVHWFNHLEDQDGHRWAQHDLVGWPTARWRANDRVLFHVELSIAHDAQPGPYVLRVGQYIYPEIENVPVLDEAGNPADYAVALPVPGSDASE